MNKIHGHTAVGYKSPTYMAWGDMRQRCDNPKKPCFHYYGGRGIKVCERWERFEAFLADMGERPDGMTLERKDNNGNYTPENCKWATRHEQQRNTRTTHMITHGGKTMCAIDWERQIGLCRGTLVKRLRAGWPLEDALTISSGGRNGR